MFVITFFIIKMFKKFYLKKREENIYAGVLQPSSIWGLATPWTYFLHLSLSSVILIDSSTGSPVHVLMLSIQAVRETVKRNVVCYVDGLECGTMQRGA